MVWAKSRGLVHVAQQVLEWVVELVQVCRYWSTVGGLTCIGVVSGTGAGAGFRTGARVGGCTGVAVGGRTGSSGVNESRFQV